ncbi:MAG: hypothetical protein AAF546_02050 [Verrucomicrobiota bacterium]
MPADKRELILDRFEASGLSGKRFATQIGVTYSTFAGWVQKRRRARGGYANEAGEPVKAPLALVEAIIEEPEHKPEASYPVTGTRDELGNEAELEECYGYTCCCRATEGATRC